MNWLTRDGWLILTAKGIRTFGYGLLSVVLGLYLEQRGTDPQMVGAILTAALAGSALLTAIMAARADRFGRRRTLMLTTGLMAASGLVFGLAQNVWLLILAALTGTISATSGEVGPFESVEQAILPQTTSPDRRNRLFGWYNTISALAVAFGALTAGLPALLRRWPGLDALSALRGMFGLYAGAALLSLGCLALLSDSVEAPAIQPGREAAIRLHRSRGTVIRLSALFALDALGGGFVLQSFVAYWFSLRFGAGPEVLGPVFFGVSLMKAASYQVAAWLADRIGLINTMVFTHLPSNLLLMLIPAMPTLPLAIVCLLARHALAQMDVPARGSYIVAVVDPEERTAATGVTTTARTIAQAISPVMAGFALQIAAFGAPFWIGGGLKILYDVALYAGFRALKPEDEIGKEPGV
jgi:MFS family permease